MDQKMLDALNNLSVCLEEIATALKDKKAGKADSVSNTLKSGNFIKQIEEINSNVKEIKTDTKKILKNQETILEISKQNSGKDSKLFESASSRKQSVKDGVGVVLQIAVAVLAIGTAFRMIGQVDFVSVMSLSLALPLIAYSFEKIAQIKELNLNTALGLIAITGAISLSLLVSSYLLSGVRPISIFQALTTIFISGAFAVIAPHMVKFISAFKDIGFGTIIKSAVFLPSILVSISTGIMLSSYILQYTKPIGLFQAITAIMISGVFAVIGFGLNKLLSAFKGQNLLALGVAIIGLPLILVGISKAISLSSIYLSDVKVIKLDQALTAIGIAAVFSVIGYGMSKLIGSFKGINPGTLATAIIGLPILLVAISAAIVGSSLVLSNIGNPLTDDQLIYIVKLGLTMSLLSFTFGLTLKLVSNIKPTSLAAGVLTIVAISGVVALSSKILSYGTYDKQYPSLKWSLGVSASLLGFSLAVVGLGIIATSGIGAVALLAGSAATLGVAATIVGVSKILQYGVFNKFPSFNWALGAGTSMVVFSGLMLVMGSVGAVGGLLNKLSLGLIPNPNKVGMESILEIAYSIVAVDKILSTGTYKNGPSFAWSAGVGTALVAFSGIVLMMGSIGAVGGLLNKLSLGMIPNPAVAGVDYIPNVAKTMVVVSKILSLGSYDQYPRADWAIGVGASLVAFSGLTMMIGAIDGVSKLASGIVKFVTFGKVKNIISDEAIIKKAQSMAVLSKVISVGDYTKYPTVSWALGIGAAMTTYTALLNSLSGNTLSLTGLLGKNDPIEKAISNMNKLGMGFMGLGKSVEVFSNSMKNLNIDKLDMLRSLTGNIVLLSLMDAKSFDAMMLKLEERSSSFNEISSKLKEERSKSTGSASGISIKPAYKDDKKNEMEAINAKMDNIIILLTDITSVVGSNGTLKEHLDSLHKQKSLGKKSNF